MVWVDRYFKRIFLIGWNIFIDHVRYYYRNDVGGNEICGLKLEVFYII